MNDVWWPCCLTLTMAASREQSGSPGLSIIPAVRYAMLSITKALIAISANFSYSNNQNTHFIHQVILPRVKLKGRLFRSYLDHPKFTQAFVELFSGRSVLGGHRYTKPDTDDFKLKTFHTCRLIKQSTCLTNQFFNHSSWRTAHTEPPWVQDVHGNLSDKAEV